MLLFLRATVWLVPITAFMTGMSLSVWWGRIDSVSQLSSTAEAALASAVSVAEVTTALEAETSNRQDIRENWSSKRDRPQSINPATTMQHCANVPVIATRSEQALHQLISQVTQSDLLWDVLVNTVGVVVDTHLTTQKFPEIHARSRLARVPVLMYHDILPEKQVFFDVTPEELEQHLQQIQQHGLTPISLDQLVSHLSTGAPLPAKPVLLSFDDGYAGHYTYVLPLLRKYGYPAVFGIYTAKVGKSMGRSSLTWAQLHEMAQDPLVTIASHSVTHKVLPGLPDETLRYEIVESKRILEEKLGIPIDHFVYPEGQYDDRTRAWVRAAGYHSALTMRREGDKFASESEDLLTIERLGQSRLDLAIAQSYGGPPAATWGTAFDFTAPIQKQRLDLEGTRLVLVSGGRPITIHADSRYQVPEIIANTNAVAAVDGGFFSLRSLSSNVMIGPVLSQNTGKFDPSNRSENPRLNGRPLVLISPDAVRFVPFDATRHQTLEGIQQELPQVTDAFVAAAWLVKDGEARSPASFGTLYGFDVPRHRAFWGINQAGQPVIGISQTRIDSVALGELLQRAGFRDAIMLDSGASTSLAYQGQSLVEGYEPRPVPHVVALLPPGEAANFNCIPTAVAANRNAAEAPE